MGTTIAAIKIAMTLKQISFSRRAIAEISTCKRDDGRNVYSKKIIAAQNISPAKKYFSCIYSPVSICSGVVTGSLRNVSEGVVTRRCVPA